MRTFLIAFYRCFFDFWMGLMELLRQFITWLWWVLWHANELNALQRPPTDSKPNTWVDRSLDRLAMWSCECRERRQVSELMGLEYSVWVAFGGNFGRLLYKHIPQKRGRQQQGDGDGDGGGETDQWRNDQLRLSEQNWRTQKETRTEQKRIEQQQHLFIVKNAFVLMPRKTQRKLTGWLCGCSGSSSHLSTWTDTHPHVYNDRSN